MVFDPDYGHFQGADGTARGFNPAQGAAAGYDPGSLLDDLQYHFKFDGGSLADSVTGTSLTGTNSPTSETGVVEQAIGINDTDESRASTTDSDLLTAAAETSTPADSSTNVPKPFTCMLWVYPQPRAYTGTTGFILFEKRSGGDNWSMSAYNVNSSVSCNFNFAVKGDGGSWRTASTTTGYAMNAWHCVVLQYYGCNMDENNSFQAHENAKRVSVVTGSAGSGAISETQIQTCCNEALQQGTEFSVGYPPNYDFNGRHDLVTRWNRILTEAEILQFYNRSKAGLAPI